VCRFLLLSCAFAGLVPGCSGITVADPGPVMFEIEHLNWSWGYSYTGYFIDDEGSLHRYDHSDEEWEYLGQTELTTAQLLSKYSLDSARIDVLDRDELDRMWELVSLLEPDDVTEEENVCFDAGSTSYQFYRFHPELDRLEKVEFYQTGSWAWRNRSAAAVELYKWLNAITRGSDHDDMCAPTP